MNSKLEKKARTACLKIEHYGSPMIFNSVIVLKTLTGRTDTLWVKSMVALNFEVILFPALLF
jgi:hypothetical protein